LDGLVGWVAQLFMQDAGQSEPQLVVPPSVQVPRPLQVSAWCHMPSLQVFSLHTVPAAQRRQPPEPSHWPSRPQVLWAWLEHSFSGSVPFLVGPHPRAPLQDSQSPLHSRAGSVFAARGKHEPLPPDRLHASQSPSQALSQHTPSTQRPAPSPAARQWLSAEQGLPTSSWGTHRFVPVSHQKSSWQWASFVHELRQAVWLSLHMKPAVHALAPPGAQMLPASQKRSSCKELPMQTSAMHCVPSAQERHTPPPQAPSRPHVDFGSAAQSSSGSLPSCARTQAPSPVSSPHTRQTSPHSPSGSAFAKLSTTNRQLPSRPGLSQRSHRPSHTASQQRPSAQKPLLHCAPSVQLVPSSSFDAHSDPEQKCVSRQCVCALQELRQVSPLQV